MCLSESGLSLEYTLEVDGWKIQPKMCHGTGGD